MAQAVWRAVTDESAAMQRPTGANARTWFRKRGLWAAPGRGGADLTPEHARRFPFFDVDFSGIEVPTLVVCGAADNPHCTPRGPDWHADAFHDAPGAEALLTISAMGSAEQQG